MINIADKAILFHNDMSEVLPTLNYTIKDLWPDAGRVHVITDPPYEDETHNAAAKGRVKRLNQLGFDGVNARRLEYASNMVRASSGWLLCFSLSEGVRAWRDAQQFAGAKWDTTCLWLKPDAAPRFNGQGPARAFENITVAWCGTGYRTWNGGGKRGVYTHNCNWKGRVSAKDGGHPTEKPLPLMRELVKDFTQPGDIVIDPFMGTGTTGEACIALNRRFVGIDSDRGWIDWAHQRLTEAEGQADLFGEPDTWRQSKMTF